MKFLLKLPKCVTALCEAAHSTISGEADSEVNSIIIETVERVVLLNGSR